MPSRSIVALVGALLVLTALDPPAPAHAAGIDVGLSGFHDIVVDEGNDHVFISQGASGAIVVTDLAGSVVTTVAGTTGAAGMTLSPDGAELWAAAPSSHAVLAVDTSTLAVTPYATASDVCPESAAVTSGLVWFGSICDTGTNGQIGALDPSDSSVTMFAQGYVPRVYASPAQPDTLISYGAYRLPATLYRYTTGAGATPTLTLSASHYAFGSGAEDAAFAAEVAKINTTQIAADTETAISGGIWNTRSSWASTGANLITIAPSYDTDVQSNAQLKVANRPSCVIQTMVNDRFLITSRGLSNDAVVNGNGELTAGSEVWLQSILTPLVPTLCNSSGSFGTC